MEDIETKRPIEDAPPRVESSKELEQAHLKGIPASAGIAVGRAIVLEPENLILHDEAVPADQIPYELNRFEIAIEALIAEFHIVLRKVKPDNVNVVAILESNLMILSDPVLLKSLKEYIEKGYTAESAIVREFDMQKQFFSHSRDELLRERAIELDNIKRRLLAVLKHHTVFFESARGSVIVAQSLTPTDIINIKEAGASAIVTEVGGIASHVSILARSFELPAVIGVKDATEIIKEGEPVIVDGFAGGIYYSPTPETSERYEELRRQQQERKAKLGELAGVETKTADGRKIFLKANVDSRAEMQNAVMCGAEGAGLIRSEQLIMQLDSIPGEAEQMSWYSEIADIAYPLPVTIRAFDIGSDKFSEGLPKREDNPALGFRGIRFLLSRRDIFETQIRAVFKVSKNKNVRFMLPMIATIEEVKESLEIIESVKKKLADGGTGCDASMPIGIMIETPSAALLADDLAKLVDFFSVGTNDLTQYALAADRANELVSDLYDPFQPAALRLIKFAVDAGAKANIPVGICGELAGHSAATALLIGMGITELSVASPILLELKSRILEIDFSEAQALAAEALACSSYKDVMTLLESEHVE